MYYSLRSISKGVEEDILFLPLSVGSCSMTVFSSYFVGGRNRKIGKGTNSIYLK